MSLLSPPRLVLLPALVAICLGLLLERAPAAEEEEAALRNELRHGQVSLAEAVSGAQRFADGAGRHGTSA